MERNTITVIGCLNNRWAVYGIVAITSGLISLYSILNIDIINNDGLLYVSVAKAFLSDGISGAFTAFKLPLYGILIGVVHKISGLSLENSAYTLNAVFMVIVCVLFVRIYEEVGGRHSRIWVAAILVLSLPVLNDYRAMVIRGYGFWAFMLLALYYFIRYSKKAGVGYAIKWQLAISLATLFRIEGLAFLVLSPLYFLFRFEGLKTAVWRVIQLNSLFLVVLGACLIIVMSSSGLTGLGDTSTLKLWLSYASPGALLSSLETEADFLHERFQYLSSQGEARLILVAGLLALVVAKVAKNAGLLLLLVWGYGARRKWLRLEKSSYIVLFFAMVGMLTLGSLAGSRFFLSSRYTVLTVLLLSLVSFQYVDYLFRERLRPAHRNWHVFAWVIVMVMFLDGLISTGASKRNIRLAGEWVKTEIDADERIACNESRLAFYSDGRCDYHALQKSPVDEIAQLKSSGYRYILLWIGRNHEAMKAAVGEDASLQLVKEFINRKGARVGIYRFEGSE